MTKKQKSQKMLSSNPEIEHLEQSSEVEIVGEISSEIMDEFRSKALKELKRDLKLDGFRQGQAPEELVERHFGQDTVLRQAAETALQEEYPQLLTHFKVDPIGAPHITIDQIGIGQSLKFKIKTALMPKLSLPDFKKIATKKRESFKTEEIKVSEKEIEEVITTLEKQIQSHQKSTTGDQSSLVGADGQPLTTEKDFKIDDQNVGTLGNFKTVEELRSQIRKNVEREKTAQQLEKKRLEILEAILNETDIKLPPILLQEELNRMIEQLKQDITQAGLKFDQYLEQINKTEEDIRSEWQPQAKKRVSVQLLLNQIAQTEKIEPDPNVLEEQVKIIMDQHPGAQIRQVETYVASQLKNEAVFKLLETDRSSK